MMGVDAPPRTSVFQANARESPSCALRRSHAYTGYVNPIWGVSPSRKRGHATMGTPVSATHSAREVNAPPCRCSAMTGISVHPTCAIRKRALAPSSRTNRVATMGTCARWMTSVTRAIVKEPRKTVRWILLAGWDSVTRHPVPAPRLQSPATVTTKTRARKRIGAQASGNVQEYQ